VTQGRWRLSGLKTVSRALSQLHSQDVLGFSGARQIVLRNRQHLRRMNA
jgi:CRP/FNR family nitrogen fixation transcriptional regulator